MRLDTARNNHAAKHLGAFAVLAALAVGLGGQASGCGGGGSSGGGGGGTGLGGTAAVGAPLVGAAITAKDRAGNVATTTTAIDGSYAVDVTGFEDLFLVEVSSSTLASDLYSIGTQGGGIVNLTPMTDLALRAYYDAQGLDVAAVFDTLGASSTIPTAAEVQGLRSALRDLLVPILEEHGLVAADFDIFASTFDADGSGFDGVLDDTTFSPSGYTTTATTTQTVTITIANGSATVTSTTQGAAGTSQTSTRVAFADVLEQAALNEALAGASATLEALFATITARGASLAASDLLPFFAASGYLDGGRDRDASIAQCVDAFGGRSMAFVRIERVLAFDAGAGTGSATDFLQVAVRLSESADGITVEGPDVGSTEESLSFSLGRQTDDTFLLVGNQRALSIDFGNIFQLRQSAQDPVTPTAEARFTIFATALAGAIDTVSVTCTTSTSATIELVKDPGGTLDSFGLPAGFTLPGTLAVGSVISYAATTTAPATAFTIEETIGGALAESLRITGVRIGAGANEDLTTFFARQDPLADILGQTVTLTFQRPTTFTIARSAPFGFLHGVPSQDVFLDATIRRPDPTASTVTFEVPATAGGQVPTGVSLTLDFADNTNGSIQLSLFVQ